MARGNNSLLRKTKVVDHSLSTPAITAIKGGPDQFTTLTLYEGAEGELSVGILEDVQRLQTTARVNREHRATTCALARQVAALGGWR